MTQQPPSSFARRSLLGGAAALVGGSVLGVSTSGTAAAHKPTIVRPRKLSEGDVVMLVSPGGSPNATSVDKGIALLESWGLTVRVAEHALDKFGYLSAPDADRLADLNAALADPEVRAVMATRGGYGTQRIIDEVEFPDADPKLIIGYSDITALHLAAYKRADTASLHAPMAAWNSNNTAETEKALRGALFTTDPVVLTRDPAEPTAGVEVAGTASGILLGGNLSMLCSEPENRNGLDLDDAILFIEDVGESPYRVDRLLTELLRAGTLKHVAGVAIGQFTDSTGNPGDWTVAEVLRDRLTPLGVPVIGGLRIGHGADPRVMPLGVPAELDTKAGTLTVEAAVAD
ncbi:S66 peptidase family protein [Stackebrandtia nassauensis]|uniref:Peptidase U61 LD-carboxypeptidase A n=1 Tax=Stackebrandtia nassauensis (strain DSM 44728 / CIP 108903 / NRRL B-16338 / NBRC 102104 / LLR-40K-21) TaxID=446470 RepID=D3PUP4_STANL|nr:LD-carboxypeptidase [Stackebrandtia nassauensis]ADD43057.1 peptidase U61 LD-carboxypeptidase A [Stackebrandtia nassauensis DSM 44728]